MVATSRRRRPERDGGEDGPVTGGWQTWTDVASTGSLPGRNRRRPAILKAIETALNRNPVVVLTGPCQCGKTTIARELLAEDSLNYFDLEDPVSLARLDEPMTALRPLRGLVVVVEIQRLPDLFPVLQVLADRRSTPARFLILGSASGDLLRQSSESLAGRAERIAIGGFSM